MKDEEKKEINKLKEKYQTEFLDDYELRFIFNVVKTQQEEIEKKDKIIDEMAKELAKVNYLQYCNTSNCDYPPCNKEKCIKKYFINKVEKENKDE